jgi:signal transduction histidine kinase
VAHDHANIMLVEDDSAYIADYQNRTVNQAFDKVAPSLRFPVEENFYLGRMVETNQPVIVYDIANDPNWQVVPRFHVEGSYLGSPITVEDTVIGFLNVINLKKNFYTSIHARHLLAFANQAGIAIKNAQLYEQAKFAAALEERQRLARELHDSVSQSLFAAHSLATLIPRVHLQKPEKTLEYAATISQRIKGALDQMRVILIELYPDAITHTELGVLLKQLCAAHTESTDVAVQFSCADHILLDQEAQIVYYRITQEALHNIEKHADASQVVIKLQRDGDTITLLVKDDGCGFDLNAIPHHHFGVHNMIDRAESIGAALHVMSESGKGTQIILEGQFS